MAVQAMMRALSASAAERVVFTLADVSAMGSAARINTPGRGEGCWTYRAPDGYADAADTAYLSAITEIYGRKRTHERD